MFTEQTMKITDRVRRLLWRGQTFTYRVWVGSTVVSMFAFKSFVVALGPKDTRACRRRRCGRMPLLLLPQGQSLACVPNARGTYSP